MLLHGLGAWKTLACNLSSLYRPALLSELPRELGVCRSHNPHQPVLLKSSCLQVFFFRNFCHTGIEMATFVQLRL